MFKITAMNAMSVTGHEVSGKCPYCGNSAVFARILGIPDQDFRLDGKYMVAHRKCPHPECQGYVFSVSDGRSPITTFPDPPKPPDRPEPHLSVPDEYRKEYIEAAVVLGRSPKASAALSRRLLQQIIREHLNIKKKDLSQEIDEVLKNGLPTHLAEAIDAIRNIGNFAAHPMKYTNTGEIVDVEPGEAEWTLDVLDLMFDFYFIQPADAKAKKDALNNKLQQLGKPLMK